MAGFLNADTLSNLTGVFERHYQQFSSEIGNYVTIVKSPTQVINTNINSISALPGYNSDELNNTDISYIEKSQIFPCMIIYPNSVDEKDSSELKFGLSVTDIAIKVKEDCKNYILNGKTEYAMINEQNYNCSLSYNVQNYFGSLYYYFKLSQTQ